MLLLNIKALPGLWSISTGIFPGGMMLMKLMMPLRILFLFTKTQLNYTLKNEGMPSGIPEPGSYPHP